MKVIQMGMGGMGNAWIKAMQQLDDIEYAAFVEINDEIAAEQIETYGFEAGMVFKTLAEAIEAVEADGILDITPPQFRRGNAITALQAGIPTLTEKPLSDTREAAQAIVDEANRTGVLYAVAQNYRYRPEIKTLRSIVENETYGKLGSITLNFYKGLQHFGFRNGMPYPLTIDMSIHHYDLLRYVLDAKPVSISAHSWSSPGSTYVNDAAAAVFIQFDNDVRVNYTGSWTSFGLNTDWNGDWRLDCEHGVVQMVQGKITAQTISDKDNIMVYKYNPVEEIELQEMEYVDQVYMLDEFYQAVMHSKPVGTTCQDNIHSLNMVFDTIQSIESGQIVKMGE